MDGETIDYLAEKVNKKDEVDLITTRTMSGKLDFYEYLVERVKLLKCLSVSDILLLLEMDLMIYLCLKKQKHQLPFVLMKF